MVSPAVMASIGEHPSWGERLGDPDDVYRGRKSRVRPRYPVIPEVSERALLQEIDPYEQVPPIGVGPSKFVGFAIGQLLYHLGYRPPAMRIQISRVEVVRLADDLRGVKL